VKPFMVVFLVLKINLGGKYGRDSNNKKEDWLEYFVEVYCR
jgi:hypothetical protein